MKNKTFIYLFHKHLLSPINVLSTLPVPWCLGTGRRVTWGHEDASQGAKPSLAYQPSVGYQEYQTRAEEYQTRAEPRDTKQSVTGPGNRPGCRDTEGRMRCSKARVQSRTSEGRGGEWCAMMKAARLSPWVWSRRTLVHTGTCSDQNPLKLLTALLPIPQLPHAPHTEAERQKALHTAAGCRVSWAVHT